MQAIGGDAGAGQPPGEGGREQDVAELGLRIGPQGRVRTRTVEVVAPANSASTNSQPAASSTQP